MARNNPFLSRTLSSFPLSIGTGIMLESVFSNTIPRYDATRKIPNLVKIDDYSTHVYNVFTLARNILSATPVKEKNKLIMDEYFIPTLLDEVYNLASMYNLTKCKLVIFMPSYKSVLKNMNIGKDTLNHTDAFMWDLMNSVIYKFKHLFEIGMITDTYHIPKYKEKILLTTSYPVDLLNKSGDITLLESHTGKLKPKWDWYTKLHKIGTKPMNVFPFIEELVYILGDGNLVLPTPLKQRQLLYEVAVKNNWTARTTKDKIMFDLKRDDKTIHSLLTTYSNLY